MMELFTPAWKSKNEKRALGAIEKMTDPKELERAAKEAKNRKARELAVKKLAIRMLLISLLEVAQKYGGGHISGHEGKLIDDGILAEMAKKDSDRDVCLKAVEALTDRTLLADVAKNAEDWEVRVAAVKKLTDRAVLAEIAKTDSHWSVRAFAYEQLGDRQNYWALIAKNDDDWYVRRTAVENLTDQNLLADVAKDDRDYWIRKMAFEKLTDPEALKAVAEKYFADINVLRECTHGEWQKAKALVAIAKKFPEILKRNWKRIAHSIQRLHEDLYQDDPHSDIHSDMYPDMHSGGDSVYGSYHTDVLPVCIHIDNTAASLGIVFPPYPFDDETEDETDNEANVQL
jgi:hypothetical protein